MLKHSVSRLSYLFAHLHLLSSDSFSSTLLSSNLSLLSASSLLCFSSVHIVGSLTSKLPSIVWSIKPDSLVRGCKWESHDFLPPEVRSSARGTCVGWSQQRRQAPPPGRNPSSQASWGTRLLWRSSVCRPSWNTEMTGGYWDVLRTLNNRDLFWIIPKGRTHLKPVCTWVLLSRKSFPLKMGSTSTREARPLSVGTRANGICSNPNAKGMEDPPVRAYNSPTWCEIDPASAVDGKRLRQMVKPCQNSNVFLSHLHTCPWNQRNDCRWWWIVTFFDEQYWTLIKADVQPWNKTIR